MLHGITVGILLLLFIPAATSQSAHDSKGSEMCNVTSAGTTHCFRTLGGNTPRLMNSTDAAKYCSQTVGEGYSLPVLDNEDVQSAIERYSYEKELFPHGIWIAGRIILDDYWSWTDGTNYTGNVSLPVNADELNAATINREFNFIIKKVDFQANLICRLPVGECNRFNLMPEVEHVVYNNACYASFPLNNYDKSTQKWYTARNVCLKRNGDLADVNVMHSRLNLSDKKDIGYYVGLRQHRVVWDTNDGNMSDVKLTYFENNYPSFSKNETNLCLTIQYSGRWVWKTNKCDNLTEMQVVCHKGFAAEPGHTTAGSTVGTTTPDSRVPPVGYYGMIGIAIGATAFFVLSIIAAVLITYFVVSRYKEKRRPIENLYDDNTYRPERDSSSVEEVDYGQPTHARDVSDVAGYSDIQNVNVDGPIPPPSRRRY